MKQEIWKCIEGFEKYQISSYGRVKSFKNNKESILKPSKNNHGYYGICLYKNNIKKQFLIHRLVGTSFIPNPENKPDINHKNGCKSDNRVANLEWATSSENIQHAYNSRLMENTRKACKKNAIIAYEASKKPVYSKKLNMQFESGVDAASYIQNNYFEDTKLELLKEGISKLLNNKVTKSKYDFGWSYINK